jgi:hypothetical protein
LVSGPGKERGGLAEVSAVVRFGKPGDDRCQQVARLARPRVVVALQPAAEETSGGPELEHLRSLAARDLDRAPEFGLDLLGGSAQRGEEFRAEAASLRLPEAIGAAQSKCPVGSRQPGAGVTGDGSGGEEHAH